MIVIDDGAAAYEFRHVDPPLWSIEGPAAASLSCRRRFVKVPCRDEVLLRDGPASG
jgi:hypothetical protein